MQARKIAILLAVTALSVLTLFVITLLDASAFGAEADPALLAGALPDTLAFYREKISIGPDGDALVEVSAVLGKGGSGDLLLPFAFENGSDFNILSGPVHFAASPQDGEALALRDVLGFHMLNLVLDDGAAVGDTVRVRSRVPAWFDRKKARQQFGEFALSRSFVNSSGHVFRKFELALELPEGMLVHSVTRVVPAYDPKESPEPPYAVGHHGGRGWATLGLDDLGPSGNCRLDLHIRSAQRGRLPLLAGLALAALYLVFFRDVLKAKETE